MNMGILRMSIVQKKVCKAGDKCLFPHHELTNNQTKSRRKRPFLSPPQKESDDRNAAAIVKIVSQMGCVSHDSELLDSQRGKQAGGNPMEEVLGPIRRERFTQCTLRQASIREKKGPPLGKNTGQKSEKAKSLRYEIGGPVPRRD